MSNQIKYIELKSGYSDDGPAWIGRVEFSKTGKTIYFNGRAFKGNGHGHAWDLETGELYWISGIKKNGEDRHWAGRGQIFIDKSIIEEYLKLMGSSVLDSFKYIPVDIEKTDKQYFDNIENNIK